MRSNNLAFWVLPWLIGWPSGWIPGNRPVLWNFGYEFRSGHDVDVSIMASMDPGWHIYSQNLNADGPQPTVIFFEPNSKAVPMGLVSEDGVSTTFYSDLYDMDITWYENHVSFHQLFRVYAPRTIIRGRVEYLACNDQLCIPGKQPFAIEVDMSKSIREER